MLTQDILRQILSYSPDTGEFIWLRPIPGEMHCINHHLLGKMAGTLRNGYRSIRIKNTTYPCTHLAWLYMTGNLPTEEVDHINRIPNDDRWENLREATSTENKLNTSLRKDNSSGARGVCWHEHAKKWHARVTYKGITHQCGLFETFEEAKAARDKRAAQLHGDFVQYDNPLIASCAI